MAISKFDWKKELRADGYKIGKDGTITKELKIFYRQSDKAKPKELTPKQFKDLRAKSFAKGEAIIKNVKVSKDKALNLLAKDAGYKNIKEYFAFRKTEKFREFDKKAKEANIDTTLKGQFQKHLKNWSDAGFENRSEEAYETLYDLGYVDEDDYDRYVED